MQLRLKQNGNAPAPDRGMAAQTQTENRKRNWTDQARQNQREANEQRANSKVSAFIEARDQNRDFSSLREGKPKEPFQRPIQTRSAKDQGRRLMGVYSDEKARQHRPDRTSRLGSLRFDSSSAEFYEKRPTASGSRSQHTTRLSCYICNKTSSDVTGSGDMAVCAACRKDQAR
eukprot:scaffold602630_cov39-Prasinocladus_malaysianus.AAC.1